MEIGYPYYAFEEKIRKLCFGEMLILSIMGIKTKSNKSNVKLISEK